MGWFVFLLYGVFCLLLYGKRKWGGGLLFLLALTRPEGMIIAAFFAVLTVIEKQISKPESPGWGVVAAGIAGVILALGINFDMTSMLTFDSTASKGYFNFYDTLTALTFFARDFVILIREIVFAVSGGFRQHFFPAVIAGLLFFWGLMQRTWDKPDFEKTGKIETWWILSAVSSLAVVAASSWQGVHLDRYLVWIFPLIGLYLLRGIQALPLHKPVTRILFAIFIGFQILNYPFFLNQYKQACAKTRSELTEYEQFGAEISMDLTLGLQGGSGVKYLLPENRVINIVGVTNPFFRGVFEQISRLKQIQYVPDAQFDLFLSSDSSHGFPGPLVSDAHFVDVPSIFDDILYVFPMDWSPLRQSAAPLTLHAVDTLLLTDKLDIGFADDEERCDYRLDSQYHVQKVLPFAFSFHADTISCVDVARPVMGSDYFTLKTRPETQHWLAVRFVNSDTVEYQAFGSVHNVATDTKTVKELLLKTTTGFQTILELDPGEEKVNEYLFALPPEAIAGPFTRFAIHGDHLPAHYWIFTTQ
ncbi:MAG: hypothetical protein U5R06_04485 [candidate division KSB1 bacterium]|nr:hypothetical protein [candidate division KSB1 bacterium]